MKPSNPIHFPDLDHEHRQAFIRSFSQRTGEQAGQFLTEFLAGILVLLMAERPPGTGRATVVTQGSKPGRTPVVNQGSEKLLTANDVAEHLNISKAKAYRMMSTGQLPAIQFDRTTRVRKQDLEKFLDDHIFHAT